MVQKKNTSTSSKNVPIKASSKNTPLKYAYELHLTSQNGKITRVLKAELRALGIAKKISSKSRMDEDYAYLSGKDVYTFWNAKEKHIPGYYAMRYDLTEYNGSRAEPMILRVRPYTTEKSTAQKKEYIL